MFSEMDDLHDSLMHSSTYLADPALPSNVCWTRQGRKRTLCVTSPDNDEADPNGALLSVVVNISEDGFWLSRYVFEFWQYHASFKHSFVTATLPGRNRRSPRQNSLHVLKISRSLNKSSKVSADEVGDSRV